MFLLCLGMWAQTPTTLIEAYKMYVLANDAQAGTTAELFLNVKNRTVVSVWSCKLVLPEGMSFQSAALVEDQGRYPEDYDANFVVTPNNDGTVTFSCDGEPGVALTGTEGAVAVVYVNIDPTLAAGTYPVVLKEIYLEELNTTQHSYPYDVTFNWNVEAAVIQEATIEFDLNGAPGQRSPITAPVGASIVPPDDPEWEGHRFMGWEPAFPETMPEGGLTLVAQWQLNSWPVTFLYDVDGQVLKQEDVNYGETITPPADPQREGYDFDGWYPEIPETMPDSAMTFVAQWQVIYYSTVFYLDEGGPLYEGQEVAYGDGLIVPNDPTREGYTFVGWDPEIPDAMPAHDMVFIAKWEVNKWTLTFVVDNDVWETRENVAYGTKLTPPENEPSREGYTFSGWTNMPETMPDYNLTVNGTFTKNSYTVTYIFDETGGLAISYEVGYGEPVRTPRADDYPYIEGYTFVGWDNEIPETMPAHNLTFIAQWEVNKWTLTFVVDNDVWETRENVAYGTKLTPPENEPSREGYTFSGWTNMPETMPDYNLTVNGTFTRNSYHVTYILDETGAVYAEYDVPFGDYTPWTDEPTREGYTFIGWDPEIPETMPAHDMTFIAQWEIDKYNVTVLGDYAEYVTVSNMNPNYGETVTITVDVDALPDYDFVALMFEEENGNGPYNVIDMMEGNTFIVENVHFNFAVEAVFNPLFETITLTQPYTPFSSTNYLDFANSDLKAYIVTNYNTAINYAVMEEIDMVPAETGVMLVGEVGKEYKIPFLLKQIPPVQPNLLQPFLEAGWLDPWGDPFEDDTTESANYVYDASTNEFVQVDLFEGGRVEMPAKSAYLQLRGSDADKEIVHFGIRDTDVRVSGIQKNSSEDAIYDMQGRRVSKAVKGLYIINGKKVAVK